MATTLTLGTTDYTLANNTDFNTIAGLSTTNLSGANVITIGVDAGTGITGTAASGNDTLTFATSLSGASNVGGGAGNDSITVNSGVTITNTRIEGGTDNDTLIINGIVNGSSNINGNGGSDSIVFNAGSRMVNSTVAVDDSGGPFSADTLVLLNSANLAFNNSKITNFGKTTDTLVIGTTTITNTDWGNLTGEITAASLTTASIAASGGNIAELTALDVFLTANGTASITLI